MNNIYFIPVNITVVFQYLIFLLVDVINVEVVLIPRIFKKIQRKIYTVIIL